MFRLLFLLFLICLFSTVVFADEDTFSVYAKGAYDVTGGYVKEPVLFGLGNVEDDFGMNGEIIYNMPKNKHIKTGLGLGYQFPRSMHGKPSLGFRY